MWGTKTLLVVVLSCCLSSPGDAYEISCAHLYDHLKRHVRSSDAWPALQDAGACMSDAFVRRGLHETHHVVGDCTRHTTALA